MTEWPKDHIVFFNMNIDNLTYVEYILFPIPFPLFLLTFRWAIGYTNKMRYNDIGVRGN